MNWVDVEDIKQRAELAVLGQGGAMLRITPQEVLALVAEIEVAENRAEVAEQESGHWQERYQGAEAEIEDLETEISNLVASAEDGSFN